MSGKGNAIAGEDLDVRKRRKVELLGVSDGDDTVTDFIGRHDGINEA